MASKYERRIRALMDKGFSREAAVNRLAATNLVDVGEPSAATEPNALTPAVAVVPNEHEQVAVNQREQATLVAVANSVAVSARVRALIVDRPDCWDIRIFPTVLADEIEARYERRQDVLHGFTLPGKELFNEVAERRGLHDRGTEQSPGPPGRSVGQEPPTPQLANEWHVVDRNAPHWVLRISERRRAQRRPSGVLGPILL